MSFRKLLLLLLIIGVSVFCCVHFLKRPNSLQKTTIQFSTWGSESELKILEPVLAEFENENPDIKVDFMHIPQNYFQKIHLLFASNTAPDVIFMNNQYLPIYANAGMLEDLSDYDFSFGDFYEKSLKSLSWQDKIYAIPRDISNLVIYYNKDIFDKYKVAYPQREWTFEDLVEVSQKLTHRPNIFGISFEEEPLFYLPYLTSSGVKDLSDFQNKNMQKGLIFYADLRNKYYVAPKKEDSASATMAQMFLQGRLAMHLSGRWLVPKYRQEAKFDWDIVEFPHGSAGSVVPMDSSGWAVAKSSKHKQEAVRLIKYLSSKKCSEKFTQSGLIVPARVDVANSKSFLDGKKPKNAQVFLDTIETSVPTPVTVEFRQVLDKLKNDTEYMFSGK